MTGAEPQRRLDGSVAIVTGASRGIGRGCALELGAAGATVYVTGRTLSEGDSERPGSLEATVEEIDQRGGRGIAIQCDHADDSAVAALFDRVAADEGRLDILVNNAFRVFGHLDPRVPFWETPISDWDALIDVGSRSAYVATHHAARVMAPAGRGLIVNISSAGAVRYFHHLVYGIGKAALDRLTRDAARPLRPYGVTIVSVWPYVARTERVEQIEEIDLDMTESVRFVGRGIVALATDPGVMVRSGTAVTTRTLADDYGFVDIDGSLPPQQPWQPPPGPLVPRTEPAHET